MKFVTMAEARANLSEYVKASHHELVVLTKNGKPQAVLTPVKDDFDLERMALAANPKFMALMEKASKGPFVTEEEMMRRMGLDPKDFTEPVEPE